MGYSATTGPLPALACLPDDWWDPAWQAVQSPGVTRLEPVICEAAAPAAPQTPASAPTPSWGRVLATTVSLWRSRHLSWLRRRLLAVAALGAGLVAMAVGTAGLVLSAAPAAPPVPRPAAIPAPSGRAVLPASLETAPQAARPVWLSVPAIGVRTRLVDLGLNSNGTLQVPASTAVAGWFTGSPRPGAVGSAVIAGHVDSYTGPGIFFWLRTLRPGDRVYVGRTDGTMAVFTVTSVRMYAKDQFPTAAVYGAVPDAELRLITCGGVFDQALRSYLSNVVVSARLTG
jgi:sortase (surface protein transpeptidase)